MSIRDQLRAATSLEEQLTIYNHAMATYKQASNKTQRRWKEALMKK